MNQKEQAEIYKLKNMLLNRLSSISKDIKQYDEIKKAISDAIEDFIHDDGKE